MLALGSVVVFLSTLALTHPALVGQSSFWIWFGLCVVAFLAADGVCTRLPIIWYNPKALTGLKLGSIPLEDVLYHLSYLGLTLCFYLLVEGWFTPITAP